jgi:hypothetical protein
MPSAQLKVLEPRNQQIPHWTPDIVRTVAASDISSRGGLLGMSENPNKSPAREYWTKAIDTVTDTWNYFHDRSKILATSGTITSVQDALKNSPFKFAILSIIVPTLFVNGGLGAWKIFRDLPPTQVDRQIASDKEIEQLSHRAASPPDNLPVTARENTQTDNRSNEELQREFDALLQKRNASKPRAQMSAGEQGQYDLLQKNLEALGIEIAGSVAHNRLGDASEKEPPKIA